MSPTELTPGRISALLTAFYGIMPWDQDNLTDDQIANLMRELPFIRYQRDEVHLRAQFSKLTAVARDEELPARLQQLIAPSGSGHGPLVQQAWEAFILSRYRLTPDDEPAVHAAPTLPGIPAEAAAGLIAWCEAGECPDDLWLRVVPHWDRVQATAAITTP